MAHKPTERAPHSLNDSKSLHAEQIILVAQLNALAAEEQTRPSHVLDF